MVKYTATMLKFDKQGEKTGWTYIVIPEDIAQQLKPGNRKSFRVKGKLDKHPVEAIALMPMGDGSFIMAVNAEMRKAIAKRAGAQLVVQIEEDDNPDPVSSPELMECLEDEPDALAFFNSLAKGHRNYFMKWIESAKTEPTKAKRIAQAVTALARKQDYPTMMRANKGK
ncbi:YdeI/OmpD-associated family protein [Chitinophaga ginsengisoli]|uniref:Bacteriocin resistance YdeI/OmpD-like protein n=1 Tax=Chitinophaga ginsengisoli TaxID=363837 RepID=A0A2P8G2V7_9BACT|nr:YdeI/OmpD-associated family protein [Chitinophaga ginsengisoli]PSL28328.1 bacteriocin resistance YdeI/OmpD-like protein [Chitinophaga ginsengisoli]